MRLIGREDELARAESTFDELEAGPQVVAVSGEAGIGKTSLLAELAERADRRGYLALGGRCAEFETGLPFGAFVDALDDYLASQGPRRFAALGEDRLAELALVFPSLASAAGAPEAGQDERYRSHAAVRELLTTLAAEKPLVLALDDLHWADQATAELVAHLVRRPPSAPVCLLLAYRPAQLAAQPAAALEDAHREERLTSLELGGLRREEADLLLADLDPADRGRLYTLSGGNPFYLVELARHGAVEADGRPGGPEVPDRVAGALARELEALPADQRLVAQGAAVAGETFEPDLAAVAADVSEAEALVVIDELLAADLVRGTDAPRRFRFRHPIVSSAVYDSTKPGWRLAAHARVADMLEQRGAPAIIRARHVECSAKPGDQAALDVLTEAAQDANLRAPAAAAHWYGAALRLLEGADDGARLGLLIPRAQALGYAGSLDEARKALAEVLELLPADQLAIRGQVAASAARIDQLLGRHQAALSLLTTALSELPDSTAPEATELKVQLAGTCFFNGDFEGLRHWVQEALAEASERGDRSTEAAVTGTLGCAEYMTGDLDAAREHLAQAEELLDELGDEEIAGRLHSIVWCGITEVYLERFDRAASLLGRGLAVARATGHGHVTTLTRIGQALVLLWRGELEAAIELLDTAAEAAVLTGNDQFLSWALWARTWAATLRGDTPGALRYGERAVQAAGDARDPLSALASCYLAEARLEAGEDPAACRELVLEAIGGEEMPLVERGFRSHWYELLTRIELAAGDTKAAGRWAKLAAEASRGLGLEGRSAEALRAEAAVALARDDAKAAVEVARDSVALADAAGLPVEASRARILTGRSLAVSDPAAATTELERAMKTLEAVGATRYRDEAASELRTLGRRTARPKRKREALGEGVEALSDREREVADLVAQGQTNKQIASELYLSEKTIESHLARIFDKLGASKRTQVAAAIGREREPAAS